MMSTQRDYYEILGVPRNAGIDQIKKAYREAAMKHHPDRVPVEQKKQAEEKFKEISESYAVLSDEKKRQLYDQYGHAGIDSRFSTEDIFRGADFSSIFGNRGGGFSDIFEHIFSDVGADIFGGSSGRRRSARGQDLQMSLAIDLPEAATGCEKEITYARHDGCVRCAGSGAEPGSSRSSCPSCRGSGTIRAGMGFISFTQTCPDCGGEGKIIKNRCRECSGQGQVRVKKNLKVKVPAGVNSGSVLRLRQEGDFSPSGRGDLYLHIEVKPHSVFTRQGDDVRCKVSIGVLQAILGTEIEVPTLEGTVQMKIPAGTQPGAVFRLRGKGIPNVGTKRPGDELVTVEILIPTRVSHKERKLLEEWARMRQESA